LDLFIIGRSEPRGKNGVKKRSLSRLDEVCVKADLIRASRKHRFPDFSGDGEYLAHHTIEDLLGKLGTPEDDALNTFTARMLLLLESHALIGADIRAEAIQRAIKSYWRDYDGHEREFLPAFLANDILRLWRTFCVNYEARTSTEPAEQNAKRKLKNYKLKHSRLLTCYSALLFLLSEFVSNGTVSQRSAIRMTDLTPMERVVAVRTRTPEASDCKVRVVRCYEKFLRETNASDASLVRRFMNSRRSRNYLNDARLMGDAVDELLRHVGEGSRGSSFYRLLVV
jgi:hypothetical protein